MHDHHHDAAHEQEHCWYRGGPFFDELTSHLPFSVLSVALGLILAGLICFFATPQMLDQAQSVVEQSVEEHHEHPTDAAADSEPGEHQHGANGFLILFHLFHPAHMLFSAAATAAMFYRYERRWFKAMIIGFTGAVIICGISDILMPYAGALILGQHIELHICVIQHPMLVMPFAAVGVLIGILATGGGTVKSTIFSHSLHVFASSMASIFFLIGPFQPLEWINRIGMVFLFICLAVMIPCCTSDIIYPLLFTKKARSEFALSGHVHPH